MKEPKKLTPQEVAERYGVNFTTVLAWITAGYMPATDCSRPGATRRRWRMDDSDLEEFDRRRAAKKPASEMRRGSPATPSTPAYA